MSVTAAFLKSTGHSWKYVTATVGLTGYGLRATVNRDIHSAYNGFVVYLFIGWWYCNAACYESAARSSGCTGCHYVNYGYYCRRCYMLRSNGHCVTVIRMKNTDLKRYEQALRNIHFVLHRIKIHYHTWWMYIPSPSICISVLAWNVSKYVRNAYRIRNNIYFDKNVIGLNLIRR